MSVDVLQEKIRKTKNPSVLELNLSLSEIPPQFEKTAEGYGEFCRELLDAADKSGIPADRIIFDPGFGFAKTFEQQLDMMRHAELFKQRLGRVLFGISRKSFIGKITGRENPAERAGGTIAGELHLCRCGAAVIRTHNVKMLRDALAVESVLQRGEFAGS